MLYAIIAGSGIDGANNDREWNRISTPYGITDISFMSFNGKETLFMRRHGPGMNVSPHLINYHANLWVMKELGVKYIIATAAVGSLHISLVPGTLSVVKDFIDFTKRRVTTIYDKIGNEVVHTDFSIPYSIIISNALHKAIQIVNGSVASDSTYVCVDGPRYETPAEIKMFAGWGGDVVGMTGVPEVIIAREMGMEYGSLAIVTNYAAGVITQKLSHNDVLASVDERRQLIFDILEKTVGMLPDI
ncbi:MAG: MTAP family purine nucleoside phosphorylase [Armatimonadota bacterium]